MYRCTRHERTRYAYDRKFLVIVSLTILLGSWHDSEIAQTGGLYDKLADVNASHGAVIVADSAFPKPGQCPGPEYHLSFYV